MYRKNTLLAVTLFVFCALLPASLTWSQELSNVDRGLAKDMLHVVANDIRSHYYDPKLHGVDWDAKIMEAEQNIDKAPSMDMAISHIAAAVDALHDSHTNFFPPRRALHSEYGWDYQLIGERCYITQVRPRSDAASKGVKPGDEILTINGFMPDHHNIHKIRYVLEVLRPQPSLHLLLEHYVDGSSREIDVNANVTIEKKSTDLSWSPIHVWEDRRHYMRARSMELGDDLMIVKLPHFAYSNSEVSGLIAKARKHRALILDLRGNPGGAVETVKDLIGAIVEKDTKIADRVTRKGTEPVVVKSQHHAFNSKLIVLVDADSSSGSELFARVVQIEKLGIVVGDHTSGSVMESKFYQNHLGGNWAFFYGEAITDADLIMTDGKSLEHVGVTPDVTILPTPADLESGRDPVLAHAAEMAGAKLTPEAAGKLFPYEWKPE